MEILGGPLFGVAGAGESHGPAVTAIVFGTPPGQRIDRAAIQSDLDRRRPGGNKHGTPRNEKDRVAITAGLYDPDDRTLFGGTELTITSDGQPFTTRGYESGRSTGEPIAAMVLSTAKKSDDYRQLVGPGGQVRPGHTDLVKHLQSHGHVDVRGGGRSSYRATITDVIGGSIARQVLRQNFGTRLLSSVASVGDLRCERRLADVVNDLCPAGGTASDDQWDEWEESIGAAEIPAVDADFAARAADRIIEIRKAGDSVGATVEVVAVNVPPLWGDPLYHSLKARLMGTLGGLNAAEAVGIGDGFEVGKRRGSENNDAIRGDGYQTNAHGGLIGGITTGRPVTATVTFKPTSTIHMPQSSVSKDLSEIDFRLEGGRHDPCVGVRAGVTLESRLAIELLNAALTHASRDLSRLPKSLREASEAQP